MTLRSARWLDGDDEVSMSHRVALGVSRSDAGKPVIGIADTTSDLNPCNSVFRSSLEHLTTGIADAGGIPVRFPTMSLGEDLMKPSAMLYRNLAAMELEEMIRSNPIDGVVFLGNCDKTVPAALMAAASLDVPSLLLLGGSRPAPMVGARRFGTGTDLWRALDERRAGSLSDDQWSELENALACAGQGACNTMGTASTMAVITEVLGMCLPGMACLPAESKALDAAAYATGRQIVGDTQTNRRPSERLTQASFDNAITALAAVGGSTNAVIHLAAVARRCGMDASLDRMDRIWRNVPLLVDVQPCGTQLIHEFSRSGAVPALVRALGELFITGTTAGDGRPWDKRLPTITSGESAISTPADPVAPPPVLAAVFGTLAPSGAVIKVAAASSTLLRHRGRARVFDDYDKMRATLDNEAASFDTSDVLVARRFGPKAVPGMPEWGMVPIPKALLANGVRDMLRVTDGRMSGTSFGTVVLHVSPEADDGPLGLVEEGDVIVFDLDARRLDLEVPAAELQNRAATRVVPPSPHQRGWPALYQQHVLPPSEGCDLDFMVPPHAGATELIEPVIGRS